MFFPGPRRTPAPRKSGPPPTQRPSEYAPQIDESFVSALFKHPEAVKIVFDYLEKEKAFATTTTKPAPTTTTRRTTTKAPTKRTTTTTKVPSLKSIFSVTPPPKPVSANQAKINRLNSLFGLALLATNDNNKDDKKTDEQKGPTKRIENKKPDTEPRLPSLASIFGAFEPPPKRPDNVDNPLLTGEQKPDFQFFGPSDFVPKSKYSLPIHTNGPMRLKYISAKDFPFNTQFGIVPIPR